ncbi:cupin domain-containing protein [Flavobacterium sp.]|uniref:cupin domain-containing protein n=1 Tax=Flavobacterium sp. TaxID=239 RepID=UPI003919C7DD
MSDSAVFFENETTHWEVVEDKIQRQIGGFDDSIMMVNVRFEKGGIGALHHHHHAQVTHISEGRFEVIIGNEIRVLKKGDSFYIPSDVMHGVVCLEEGMLIDVFSPMREDFIK